MLYYSDSLAAAERQLQAVLHVDRNFQEAQLEFVNVLAADHRCESARAMLSEIALSPRRAEYFPAYRAAVLGRCGDPVGAKRELDHIEMDAKAAKYINPLFVAIAYCRSGIVPEPSVGSTSQSRRTIGHYFNCESFPRSGPTETILNFDSF